MPIKKCIRALCILGVATLLSPGCKTLSKSTATPEVPHRKSIEFAGRDWALKYAENPMGPGANFFSDYKENVWVDSKGFLHLRISPVEEKWRSAEVVSQDTFGYGSYIFTVQGNLNYLDPNVTLGLFTWDVSNFQTQANSEVDIEFSRWGNPNDPNTLQYAVHPTGYGADQEQRVHRPQVSPICWNGVSTHVFTWTDSVITWQSYLGDSIRPERVVSVWSFNYTAPARAKREGPFQSDSIVVPQPGKFTNVRMNLWLSKGPEQGPLNEIPTEVIVRNFRFIPLKPN